MQNKILALAALAMLAWSCKETSTLTATPKTRIIEVQGHRGDRGNFPENSIPAFISAVKKGVDVVELDVVISKDNRVVVSHEPFMSHHYVSRPNGTPIAKGEEKLFNLHTMPYDSIKKFDIGARGNSSFPKQHKLKAYKPLLSEVIDSIENYISSNNLKPVRYNIEIKSEEKEYGISQPQPDEFITLVMQVIDAKGIRQKINIQSFDAAILNTLHKSHPTVKTAYLTDKPGISKNLEMLHYTPDIYSPNYKLVNAKFIDSLHSLNVQVIPWTVNYDRDIENIIKLQPDGIITDYPERVIKMLN